MEKHVYDEKEMVTKACMIGFQTDDGCIAEVIRGNEIKLGYSLKQEIAIRNKLIEENKNKLSRIASSKAVILLGEKYVIIPGLSEPPVRTLRATIPENESHIFR